MKRRWIVRLLVLLVAVNLGLVVNSLVLSQRSEARHPPIGEIIDVDGGRVHLVDSGSPAAVPADQPPLVLIHGASTSLLDMHVALRPHLQDAHRLVLIDRPGHGYSSREDDSLSHPSAQARRIREALAARGIEQSIWVGHSWGGAVVLAGLLDAPDAVVAGVSLGGTSHPWDGGSAWHAELAATPVIGDAFAWQFIQPGGRLSLEAAIAGVFDPEPVPVNYVEQTGVTLSLRPSVYRNNAHDLTRLSDALATRVPDYPELAQPVLLVSGSADDVVPDWNHAERLADVLPQAYWHRLDGAGHGLHHTRSEVIARLISRFVRCATTAGETPDDSQGETQGTGQDPIACVASQSG